MATHRYGHHGEGADVHSWDALNWPVALTAPLVWPVWSWAADLWTHFPTPTALYMGVSAAFMLFQMSDKLGLLERLKRRHNERQGKP